MATLQDLVLADPTNTLKDIVLADPNLATLGQGNNLNQLSVDVGEIQTKRSQLAAEPIDYVFDKDWAKQAFLIKDWKLSPNPVYDETTGLPNSDYENNVNFYNRFYTTAHQKYVDTRLGGNIGINARPQFNWYSDIRIPGKLANRGGGRTNNVTVGSGAEFNQDISPATSNYGMGRYYSEAIDDHQQTIFLRFGVPSFNSLSNYFSAAYDPDMASLARTGTGKSFLYNITSIAASIATLVAFPVLSISFITGRALLSFFRTPNSKFYTLKPAMFAYWGAVNSLVNTFANNLGLLPPIVEGMSGGPPEGKQLINTTYTLSKSNIELIIKMLPDIFGTNMDETVKNKPEYYGIDVRAVANKAQRMANALARAEYNDFGNNNFTDAQGYLRRFQEPANGIVYDPTTKTNTLLGWVKKHIMLGYYFSDKFHPAVNTTTIFGSEPSGELDPDGKPIYKPVINTGEASYFDGLWNAIDSEMQDGSAFATFKVDFTGPQSESFSNSTVESQLSQDLNGLSSSNRETRFKIADGNIADGIIGSAVGGAISAIGDVVSGALNGATFGTFGALQALSGNGFFDIPKHWQSSSASLSRSSYTMQLISPYGNVISQLQNIFIPLAMIMTGSLPLSTGKTTYTSPFLVQVYDRGRCQIQLGIVESLTITRGTSNLAFDAKGRAMAIDVTFNVVDLSSIMHMPLSTGGLFSTNPQTDPDNILMDYISVLTAQDIYTQIYQFPRAKLALAGTISKLHQLTSPYFLAGLTNEWLTTGMGKYLFPISWPWAAAQAISTGNSALINNNGAPS